MVGLSAYVLLASMSPSAELAGIIHKNEGYVNIVVSLQIFTQYSRFAYFLRQFGRLVLFIEKARQKYRLSISNIIFLDIKTRISDIKSSLDDGFL